MIIRSRYGAMLHCLGRAACNKCLTDVDMFVYIAAREKREHRPLFPHVDRGSAVQTTTARCALLQLIIKHLSNYACLFLYIYVSVYISDMCPVHVVMLMII